MQTIESETSQSFYYLGINKKTYAHWQFYFDLDENHNSFPSKKKPNLIVDDHPHKAYTKPSDWESYPAYTLDEILEMLPYVIHECCYLELCKSQVNSFAILYRDVNDGESFYGSLFLNKNPAEAAAQLLIWCIEQGYVKVEDVNDE